MKVVLNSPCTYSYAGIQVYDKNGNMLFYSTNEDERDSFIHKSKTGAVKLRACIPNSLLQPGTYFIHLTIYEKGCGNLDKVMPALTFEVVDNQTRRGARGLYRHGPIIAPLLNWTEEDVAVESSSSSNALIK